MAGSVIIYRLHAFADIATQMADPRRNGGAVEFEFGLDEQIARRLHVKGGTPFIPTTNPAKSDRQQGDMM